MAIRRGFTWLVSLLAAVALFAGGPGFRSQRQLDDHYARHGAEFGRITKAEYLAAAQDFRDARLTSDILEHTREDRVITRFHKKKGWFIAFNQDRTIRTFFIPADGERYFRRQSRRGRSGAGHRLSSPANVVDRGRPLPATNDLAERPS